MRGFSVKVAAAVPLSFVFLLLGSHLVRGGAVEISEGAASNSVMASGKIPSCGRGDVVVEDPKFPRSETKLMRRLGSRQGTSPPSPIRNRGQAMDVPPPPEDQI